MKIKDNRNILNSAGAGLLALSEQVNIIDLYIQTSINRYPLYQEIVFISSIHSNKPASILFVLI